MFTPKFLSLFFSLILFFTSSSQAAFTWEEFKSHTKDTVTGAFDETGWWILGVGSVTTVLARQADDDFRKTHGNNQTMHPSVSKVGDFWGDGIPQVLFYGSQFFLDREKSIPSLEGYAISAATVQVLKHATQRERPNKKNNLSYPSGHSQSAFALATTMTWSYGWKYTWALWPMAVLTAFSRVADDRHWLSDVTAGATIGILFGRAGFAHHENKSILPTVLFHEGNPDGLMVNAEIRW